MQGSNILVVGDTGCVHCDTVTAVLRNCVDQDQRYRCCRLSPESLEASHQNEPLTVVFAGVRRDQFSRRTIEQTRERFPLARIVIVQSEWCVGKKLPEDIFPGVVYVRIGEWKSYVATNLGQNGDRRSLLFDLPVTASAGESRMFASDLVGCDLAGVRFAIVADSFADFDAVKLMCEQLGGTGVWIDQSRETASSEADVVIVSCSDSQRIDIPLISNLQCRIRSSSDQVPIILLTSFPRVADRRRLESLGIRHVIAQPFELGEFVASVRSLLVAQ